MKKLVVVAVILSAFSFVACKKERVCSCTTTCPTGYAGCTAKTEDSAPFTSSKKVAKETCDRMSSSDNMQTTECVVK